MGQTSSSCASQFVEEYLKAEKLWPELLVQLNPSLQLGATIDELVADGAAYGVG